MRSRSRASSRRSRPRAARTPRAEGAARRRPWAVIQRTGLHHRRCDEPEQPVEEVLLRRLTHHPREEIGRALPEQRETAVSRSTSWTSRKPEERRLEVVHRKFSPDPRATGRRPRRPVDTVSPVYRMWGHGGGDGGPATRARNASPDPLSERLLQLSRICGFSSVETSCVIASPFAIERQAAGRMILPERVLRQVCRRSGCPSASRSPRSPCRPSRAVPSRIFSASARPDGRILLQHHELRNTASPVRVARGGPTTAASATTRIGDSADSISMVPQPVSRHVQHVVASGPMDR